jgi:GT2 family glycosyltransferase
MTPAAPLVVSVILKGKQPENMLACLDSLAGSNYPNHVELVVDYPSAAGSLEPIRAAHPQVQLIVAGENRGYAGNNNFGIQWALEHSAEWVFVLNDDTVLAPDCLSRLVDVGQTDGRIGILGPMVYHYYEPDVIQTAGGQLGPHWQALLTDCNQRDQGQYREPRTVDWISGCAMLVRRQLIEQIGVLDERFFMYWEEIDWCLQASRAGWHLIHVPQAKLWHKGVQRDYRPEPAVTYYTTRNHFLLLAKNHAPVGTWLALTLSTARTLSSWTLKPRWRSMRPHRDAMLHGVWDFVRGRWGMWGL